MEASADPQLPCLPLDKLEVLDLGLGLSSEPGHIGSTNSIEKALELLPEESNQQLQPVDLAAVNFSIASNSDNRGDGSDTQVSLAGLMNLCDIVRIAETANSNDRGPSELEYFQFSSSFLFYTNRLLEQSTVTNVVYDTSTKLIGSHENSLSLEQKAAYDELVKPLCGQDKDLHWEAKIFSR